MKKAIKMASALAICSGMILTSACGQVGKTVTGSKGDQYQVSDQEKSITTDGADQGYEPYSIFLNLERSGIGQNIKATFTSAPKRVLLDGDQMTDMFLDLGLEDRIVGYTRGACLSTVSNFPARDSLNKILPDGSNLSSASKEQILDLKPDFMMGWDSLFSENHFSVDWCLQNHIIPYFPYCCSDSARMEDIYKDYEVLGHIFDVSDRAKDRVEAMKAKINEIHSKLGEESYQKPVSVFVYDSGEEAPFTACQGIPGDMIQKAGGLSIFHDIQKGWATPSWEEVVQRDPDVILVLDYNHDTQSKINFLKSNEATKNLRAVRDGRIYSACCADMQGSAGSANAIEIMARQFYPDKFR